MKTSTRKSFGLTILIVALLGGIAFCVSGMPFLSLESSHSSSFPGGFMLVQSYKMHWPLYAVGLVALVGLVTLLWPARKPPKLRS